jgi:hypothetical protein
VCIVSSHDRKADAALLASLSDELSGVTVGPLSAQNAMTDWNNDHAPIPDGTKRIVTNVATAPKHIASEDLDYLPNYLARDAGHNAIEYLQEKRHQEFVEIATGRYSYYYGCQSRVSLASAGNYLNILVPIGEYGADAALVLLRATYYAMCGASSPQLEQLNILAEEGNNRELILNHTTFGRNELLRVAGIMSSHWAKHSLEVSLKAIFRYSKKSVY